jgi:IS30 family transposase
MNDAPGSSSRINASITDPAIVNARSRLGDWEGDLIVGPMSRSAVATLVERRSRLLRLVHLPNGHASEHLVTAVTAAMANVEAGKLLTLTWDQGSEMARHNEIAKLFSEGVFFADPGCPWMRGTNENTNGLVRQYLPKGKDLRAFSPLDLADIETRSTAVHARRSDGKHQPKRSCHCDRLTRATCCDGHLNSSSRTSGPHRERRATR